MSEKEEVRKFYDLRPDEEGRGWNYECASLDDAYGVYDQRVNEGTIKVPYKIVEVTATSKVVAKLVPKLTK
jgi:hypothetical protein